MVAGSGLESREYDRWPRGTFCPQKLALTSPTSDGRSLGIQKYNKAIIKNK
jgi:hypothetical protein